MIVVLLMVLPGWSHHWANTTYLRDTILIVYQQSTHLIHACIHTAPLCC